MEKTSGAYRKFHHLCYYPLKEKALNLGGLGLFDNAFIYGHYSMAYRYNYSGCNMFLEMATSGRLSGLKPSEQIILMHISSYMNSTTGDAWPTIETLRMKAGVSDRTISDTIKKLEKKKILKVRRSKVLGNRYSIIWDNIEGEEKVRYQDLSTSDYGLVWQAMEALESLKKCGYRNIYTGIKPMSDWDGCQSALEYIDGEGVDVGEFVTCLYLDRGTEKKNFGLNILICDKDVLSGLITEFCN